MENPSPSRKITRRQLIGASLAAGLGGAALLRGGARPARAANENHHLVWVWQFSTDAEPNHIGSRLRNHNLGVILKTHDGVDWMSKYDKSRYAVSGPAQLQVLAEYFENAGVPFHAWCVVHGSRPIEEARMAAAALHSGARSLFLDVEPHSGFWRGTPADAAAFGRELRTLAPEAEVILSIDARPWLRDAIPIREFASYVNSIAPQHYWRTFDTRSNYEKYAAAGYPAPEGGMTPEFLLSTTQNAYAEIGLPMHHTGQGATDDPGEWHRFVDSAFALGTDYVSVWRYGVTPDAVLDVLTAKPARQPVIPVVAGAGGTHVVQSGETLSLIAVNYGTTVDALVQANGLSDPNYLYVGQELAIPGGGATLAFSNNSPAPPPAAPAPSGGSTYVVQAGDTLFGIAGQFGSSVNAIASANGLADPNYIYVGQQLTIP